MITKFRFSLLVAANSAGIMLASAAHADATVECNVGPGAASTECGVGAAAAGLDATAIGNAATASGAEASSCRRGSCSFGREFSRGRNPRQRHRPAVGRDRQSRHGYERGFQPRSATRRPRPASTPPRSAASWLRQALARRHSGGERMPLEHRLPRSAIRLRRPARRQPRSVIWPMRRAPIRQRLAMVRSLRAAIPWRSARDRALQDLPIRWHWARAPSPPRPAK